MNSSWIKQKLVDFFALPPLISATEKCSLSVTLTDDLAAALAKATGENLTHSLERIHEAVSSRLIDVLEGHGYRRDRVVTDNDSFLRYCPYCGDEVNDYNVWMLRGCCDECRYWGK